jgi:hypothetical protein
MHNEKLVTCIKVAGKVLREQKDQVFIPFGSEYSIYLKNLNTVRALVRIQLDGVDVTDGTDLVVQPNSSIDLERFMKKGNLSQGNRFKFIERSGKVEAHRGVQAEDGLLRVEFQFEKVAPKVETVVVKTVHEHVHHDYWDPWYGNPWRRGPFYNYTSYNGAPTCGGMSGSLIGSASKVAVNSNSLDSASCSVSGTLNAASSTMSFNAGTASAQSAPTGGVLRSKTMSKLVASNAEPAKAQYSGTFDYLETSAPVNEAGITVPGSISNQQFHVVASFPVEDEKHVIILKLLGETGKGKVVKQAVTVKHAQTCVTCGTRNRGKLAQFCRECGTALEVA